MIPQCQTLMDFLKAEWASLLSIPLFRHVFGVGSQPPAREEELASLPCLTREDLARTRLERRTLTVPGYKVMVSSSGTTGPPVMLLWSDGDEVVARDVVRRVHKHVPWYQGDVVLVYAPLGLASMWRHMQRQAEVAGATLILPGAVDFDTVLDLIGRHRVSVLLTLPSLALRLGERALAQGRDLGSIRQVACGGDVLSTQRQLRIEETWQAVCYNFFGMSEIMGPMAGECPHRGGLHVDSSFAVEVRADQHSRGCEGESIVTALWRRASPIVRYCTGDVVSAVQPACSCESGTVIRLHGKREQCPVHRGVRLLHDELDDIVLGCPGTLCEWQLDLSNERAPELQIEGRPERQDVERLREDVSAYVGEAVDIVSVPELLEQRSQPKPKRIIVRRMTSMANA